MQKIRVWIHQPCWVPLREEEEEADLVCDGCDGVKTATKLSLTELYRQLATKLSLKENAATASMRKIPRILKALVSKQNKVWGGGASPEGRAVLLQALEEGLGSG